MIACEYGPEVEIQVLTFNEERKKVGPSGKIFWNGEHFSYWKYPEKLERGNRGYQKFHENAEKPAKGWIGVDGKKPHTLLMKKETMEDNRKESKRSLQFLLS